MPWVPFKRKAAALKWFSLQRLKLAISHSSLPQKFQFQLIRSAVIVLRFGLLSVLLRFSRDAKYFDTMMNTKKLMIAPLY